MSSSNNDDRRLLRKRRSLPEEEEEDEESDGGDGSSSSSRRPVSTPGGGGVPSQPSFGVTAASYYTKTAAATAVASIQETESRTAEAAKQLLCGGVAGSVAKTVTAPFSRLTILFQVHSLVTTKEHRPRFAMTLRGGVRKIIERGGILSMWRGNMTSVLHRFPYSAINFYIYENTLDFLSSSRTGAEGEVQPHPREAERDLTQKDLVRRVSKIVLHVEDDDDDEEEDSDYVVVSSSGGGGGFGSASAAPDQKVTTRRKRKRRNPAEDTPAMHKFMAGAVAGSLACLACYPLDLVRTRLTTEMEGLEHYRGIVDAFQKIFKAEGMMGFYSGVGPTLLVAVPNFAISYTVYGTLKEYTLDDELFYNLRRIDSDSGEAKLGFGLTILCGACSGILATLVTFPMDTIRRRMQIQNLHVPVADRLSSQQQLYKLVTKEGLGSLYRGLTPELLKVVPMVGTLFVVYEWTRDMLNVRHDRR